MLEVLKGDTGPWGFEPVPRSPQPAISVLASPSLIPLPAAPDWRHQDDRQEMKAASQKEENPLFRAAFFPAKPVPTLSLAWTWLFMVRLH